MACLKKPSASTLKKLNLWIAKHVMQWEYNGFGWYSTHRDGHPIARWGSDFKPTYDLIAAMEVLKKCGKKVTNGTSFVCIQFSEPGTSTLSKKGHWNVGRIKDGRWDGEIGQAEELEVAICLFAKVAFGRK